MRVLLRAAHAELEICDALETQRDRRPAGGVLIPRFPDAPVRPESIRVPVDELGQMLGADLLLALVEDAHAERQLAHRRAVGLDRLKARDEVAFVVGYAACEQMAIAFGRLERRGVPLVERIGRLYVVVVVDQQRLFTVARLADDRGRSA